MHFKYSILAAFLLLGGLIDAVEVKTKTVVKENGKTVKKKVVTTKTADRVITRSSYPRWPIRSRRTYYYMYPSRSYTYYTYDAYSPRCAPRCRQRCRRFCRRNTRLSIAACRSRCRHICFSRCG